MSEVLNISIVGVGGQGTLLASDILCHAALLAGSDVKKSEVHGMAQRGGSVVSQVRIGDRVHSPLIAIGATDILVAFEKLEALRHAHYLAPNGLALVSDQEIPPSPSPAARPNGRPTSTPCSAQPSPGSLSSPRSRSQAGSAACEWSTS